MHSIISLEILELEHQQQARLLACLHEALESRPADLDEALTVVVALDQTLHEHFKREEEELFPLLHDGLSDENDQQVLDQLIREHVELLLEASILRLKLQENPPPSDLRQKLFEFSEFFENHSRLEHHLVQQFRRRCAD